MKHRYEALLVLNTQAKEDTRQGNRRSSGIRISRRKAPRSNRSRRWTSGTFSYVAGPLDAGYYVNFVFNADPQLIVKLRSKFKLDPEVYRQHYQRLEENKEKAPQKSGKIEMTSL